MYCSINIPSSLHRKGRKHTPASNTETDTKEAVKMFQQLKRDGCPATGRCCEVASWFTPDEVRSFRYEVTDGKKLPGEKECVAGTEQPGTEAPETKECIGVTERPVDSNGGEALERLREVCGLKKAFIVLCEGLPGFYIWYNESNNTVYLDITRCKADYIDEFVHNLKSR